MGTEGNGQDIGIRLVPHRPRAVPVGREDVAAKGPLGVLADRRQSRLRHCDWPFGRSRRIERSKSHTDVTYRHAPYLPRA